MAELCGVEGNSTLQPLNIMQKKFNKNFSGNFSNNRFGITKWLFYAFLAGAGAIEHFTMNVSIYLS
jgi:hypothetical protein